MSISNKILVTFFLEDGCSQEEGEVSVSWVPINFSIYSPLFHEMVDIAVGEWLSDNKLDDLVYEVIFSHVVEFDGGGAVVGEYFEPIHTDISAR
jgi:hypothetical protein